MPSFNLSSPFTEFYCVPASGNNTFAGSTLAPPILVASGCGWQSGTGGAGGVSGANYISFTGTQDLSILTRDITTRDGTVLPANKTVYFRVNCSGGETTISQLTVDYTTDASNRDKTIVRLKIAPQII